MTKTINTIAASLVVAAASPAFADDKMEIGAFAGLHLWSDNNELGIHEPGPEEIENSIIFGIRIGRRLAEFISAEGELGLSPSTTDESGTDVVALAYRLHAIVHPVQVGKLEPFALLGFGGSTAASSEPQLVENDTDFVWHAGVGFKYRVGRDWGVRFDARLLLPPARDGLVTTDGEFLVGIYKTFPAKPAAKPAAPPPPAPTPTPTDADGDGIEDPADKCPTEVEDRNGFADDDGCIDADNDGDGVADASDRCPSAAETANSYQDDDGCPDEVPAQVKQFTGVIKGIDFATGSDRLAASSSKILDEAVEVLNDHPALRLEISGHTDSTGDAAFNRDLSQRRAEAVKTYLVQRGVAAERLEAVGHGPDKAIADNATPEGRAKNRRVEFKAR